MSISLCVLPHVDACPGMQTGYGMYCSSMAFVLCFVLLVPRTKKMWGRAVVLWVYIFVLCAVELIASLIVDIQAVTFVNSTVHRRRLLTIVRVQ